MVQEKEVRYLMQPVELRTVENNEDGSTTKTLLGYVVKWNQRSHLIWGEFYEKVAKGAFARSLKEDVIKALWNHRSDFVLGSTKPGTLRLEEDDIGLRFEIDLPNNSWGNDACESVGRGDVDGVSFGFNVRENGYAWQYLIDEDVYERTLLDVKLSEVSPTPFPAYPDSEISQRSLENLGITTKEQRRLEKEKLLIEIDLLAI